MTLLGKGSLTVTTELKTTFLSPAKQEDVKCTARILKLGKSLIYGAIWKAAANASYDYVRLRTSENESVSQRTVP